MTLTTAVRSRADVTADGVTPRTAWPADAATSCRVYGHGPSGVDIRWRARHFLVVPDAAAMASHWAALAGLV
ncbi:MAG: hypothetical protein JO272_15970 [Pseudonocardiales bacterium]|nr:hypothetical protein [Pseudonocardiales bacterium]